MHLLVNLTRLLFLLGSQMLPNLHTVQHALLLLRGQGRKMLQPLPEQLLLIGRQTAECRIALQGTFLLPRRYVLVTA